MLTLEQVKKIDQPQENEQEIGGVTFAQFQLPLFLQEGLDVVGFSSPTKIQAQSIPVLLDGKDLVAQSQTGSGKTAAFAIPILSRIQRKSRDIQALIIVPTRELALQVTDVFKSLSRGAVRVTPIYGGAGMEGQIRGLLHGGYHVVVGTPGRLLDHLNRGTLKLNKLQMLVLDEADELLDRGFTLDVEAIIRAAPPAASRQTALFSATLPERVNGMIAKHLREDHESILLNTTAQRQLDIKHLIYDIKVESKHIALRHLLDTNNTSPLLIFARTKHGVKKLTTRLQSEGYAAAGLQGNLSQRAREDVLSSFRSNKTRIMICTNLGARGLDVSGITHVINYDLPENAEWFTHRVGRTGRNGASGTAITFLTGEDRAGWRDIERIISKEGIEIERKPWPGPFATPGAIATPESNSSQMVNRRGAIPLPPMRPGMTQPRQQSNDDQPRQQGNRSYASPRSYDDQPRQQGNRSYDDQPRQQGNRSYAGGTASPRSYDDQPRQQGNRSYAGGTASPRSYDDQPRQQGNRSYDDQPRRSNDEQPNWPANQYNGRARSERRGPKPVK